MQSHVCAPTMNDDDDVDDGDDLCFVLWESI